MIVRGALGARIDLGEGLLDRALAILVQVNASVFGVAGLPFRPFVELILAEGFTAANVAMAVAGLVIVGGLAVGVVGLYAATVRRVARREQRNYRPAVAAFDRLATAFHHGAATVRIWPIPHWGGAGALAWRQLLGARRHWGSLLTAMIAPAVLASAPGFVIGDPLFAFLCTAGTLAFYTFLLLPTALRFDFRRDLDRLATLKGLPITPAAAAIGQTLAPVLIATAFQSVVLAFAIAARSLPPHLLGVAMLVMIPLNVLVFGLDNLIYLLYPYRVQQEGLEIFLRTMLTFTGKGLLFTAAMAGTSAWGFAAAAIAQGTGGAVSGYAVFAAGMIAGAALLAGLVLYELSRTFGRMNAIEDLPR